MADLVSQDYYSFLARTMAAAGQDQTQLRAMIYRLARLQLQQELQRKYELGVQEQLSALERAIEKIEADVVAKQAIASADLEAHANSSNASKLPQTALVVQDSSAESGLSVDPRWEVLPPLYDSPYAEQGWRRSIASQQPRHGVSDAANQSRANFWFRVQLVAAVLLGVVVYALIEPQDVLSSLTPRTRDTGVSSAPANGPAQNTLSAIEKPDKVATAPSTIGGAPLPSSYGVYAISGGQLSDLALLPIRVPDPRVAISAPISNPTHTTLPDGRVQFIAFQRDLVNNAPDRATVRIVARVARALTVDAAGKAKMTDVADSWAVRSNAYDMRVAPVNGNPEMILIRSPNPDFSFPPGRYALVIKGLAYDFNVPGPITDTAQCLERTDALNAAVYSECRNP